MVDSRLAQHIGRGNEDGLLISSVASASNLWALIMDAGTGFSAQVYELSPQFLHKVSYILLALCFNEERNLTLHNIVSEEKNNTSHLRFCPPVKTLTVEFIN